MGQLKVKVIHASVTKKLAWQLNTIQTKSTHDLAQHFVGDRGMFHLNFLLTPLKFQNFFTIHLPLDVPFLHT